MTKDTEEVLKGINTRFDDIEKLLKLSLINNLMEDTEQIVKHTDAKCSSELQNILNGMGVVFGGFSTIYDLEVVIMEIPEGTKLKIRDYSWLCSEIHSYYPDKEPLLMFKTINGMQRKRILQEEISFGVQGKELHVSKRGNRR